MGVGSWPGWGLHLWWCPLPSGARPHPAVSCLWGPGSEGGSSHPGRGHVGDRDGPGQQPAGQRLPDLQASVPPLEAQSPATSRVTSEPPLSGAGRPPGGGTEPGLPGVTSGLTTPGGRRGLEPLHLQEGLPDADIRALSSLVSRLPGPKRGRGLRAASGRAQDGGGETRADRTEMCFPVTRAARPAPPSPPPGHAGPSGHPLHPPRAWHTAGPQCARLTLNGGGQREPPSQPALPGKQPVSALCPQLSWKTLSWEETVRPGFKCPLLP